MFEKTAERYMTRAIAEELHPEIAMTLWKLIDDQKAKGTDLDYLQVFELSVKDGQQAIIHRQEEPFGRQERLLPLKWTKPIERTIWCIDNREGQMMLFPEDY
ncbi:DUF960 family protein [Bacillus badius]|uniref:DUF960 family protein n=1 Tax=Bacillus badius TaxID=1455 RepID=UPI002E1B9235|nr:DUF960 family protein [Bacillus badius]